MREPTAAIAVPPAWATESMLDEGLLAVVHDREGDSFHASTGNLKDPVVLQHLIVQQIDRLRLLRTEDEQNAAVGLVCDREDVQVILVQHDPHAVELVAWPVAEAKKLHKALGDLLDAFDTAGGE
jgi:hypothetical protein